MSKGSQIAHVRLSKELFISIEQALRSANRTRIHAPYTQSEWVRQAIREKLNHLSRSRKKRSK